MGILDTIRILLKNEGFMPYTALGGKKGLEQIAALKPDIDLTDVRMPDVTGLEILAVGARARSRSGRDSHDGAGDPPVGDAP